MCGRHQLRSGGAGRAHDVLQAQCPRLFAEAITGHHEGFQARPARWYRRELTRQGLQSVGSHLWLGPSLAGEAAALERM